MRRSLDGWGLLLLGSAWLQSATAVGGVLALAGWLVGGAAAGMGVASLLLPGDRRIVSFAALAFVAGLVLALLLLPFYGVSLSLRLTALAAAGALLAGWMSLKRTPPSNDGGGWAPTVPLIAKVALDEAMLGSFHLRIRFPRGELLERVIEETALLRARHEALGFLADPLAYHRKPLPLQTPRVERRRHLGVDYEHLVFDSEWEPAEGEPGRVRWLEQGANRTGHAYVVRGDPMAPWLVAISGYRMGLPLTDLTAFDPREYHRRLGLNLLIPVLPLHGPRRAGRRSGDGFLDADPIAFTQGEAQAIWDIRRLIGWVREQGGRRVGVLGLSLGGYNAALLACVEPGLSCVVAGVPATDFSRIFSRHAPLAVQRACEAGGLDLAGWREVLRPVSPLAMEPQVPWAGRAVFAGLADRVVMPDQPRDLISHWGAPRHAWYAGGHLSYRGDRGAHALVREVLVERLGARRERSRQGD